MLPAQYETGKAATKILYVSFKLSNTNWVLPRCFRIYQYGSFKSTMFWWMEGQIWEKIIGLSQLTDIKVVTTYQRRDAWKDWKKFRKFRRTPTNRRDLFGLKLITTTNLTKLMQRFKTNFKMEVFHNLKNRERQWMQLQPDNYGPFTSVIYFFSPYASIMVALFNLIRKSGPKLFL